jgi:hypothetical protein
VAIIHIDTEDPRSLRALQICAAADRWIEVSQPGGWIIYLIPSASQPTRRYAVTAAYCTCEDFKRRHDACKHMQALILHLALRELASHAPAI